MPMPYVRVWIHMVWSTKDFEPVLEKELREKLYAHILENAKSKNIFLDCINGFLDHVHVLISLKADQSPAKVAQLLKGESSHWLNGQRLTPLRFEWQEEYFAVSVSESALENVRSYIKRQEQHHRKKTFAEEYKEFIQKYGFVERG